MKKLMTRGAIIAIAIGILFRPVIYPFVISLKASKYDKQLGRIQPKSPSELHSIYKDKNVLIIGGTRGVGRGIALTVAKAGADVTVVGRSEKSGKAILQLMKQHAQNAGSSDGSNTSADDDKSSKGVKQDFAEALAQQRILQQQQRMNYVQGDIGSVRSAKKCIKSLTDYIKTNQGGEKFDYIFVTAAIFPYWNDLMNEDGLERSFGIAVIGRYLIYSHLEHLLEPDNGRMLNVIASGMDEYPFDRELASGSRTDGSLFQFVMNFACGTEMMMIGLSQRNEFYSKVTRVSTHPGVLKTDLHRGQGWIMDLIESVMVTFIGFTEEEAGVRQASILSSSQLTNEHLNYVDEFMKGRLLGSKVPLDEHLDWLMNLIDEKIHQRE